MLIIEQIYLVELPPSVSCHTIPSKVTLVPGSQGPKQSGSVIVPTLVPVHVPVSLVNRWFDCSDSLWNNKIECIRY